MYLLGHHGCLDSVGHCIHTGSHLQVIQSLILLTNSILSIDPRSLLVSLFKSLHDACVSVEIMERDTKKLNGVQDRMTLGGMLIVSLPLVHLFHFSFLSPLLLFALFSSSLHLLGRELWRVWCGGVVWGSDVCASVYVYIYGGCTQKVTALYARLCAHLQIEESICKSEQEFVCYFTLA